MHRLTLVLAGFMSIFLLGGYARQFLHFLANRGFKKDDVVWWLFASVVDHTFNSIVFSCFVIWREKSAFSKLFWSSLIMLFGGLASSMYVFYQLSKLLFFHPDISKQKHPAWPFLLRSKEHNFVSDIENKLSNKYIAKYLFSGMASAMSLIVVWCLIAAGSPFRWAVWNQPLLPISLVSFFTQVGYIASWIWFKEPTIQRRLLWICSLFLLGSIGTNLYLLKEITKLSRNQDSWEILHRQRIPGMGLKRDESEEPIIEEKPLSSTRRRIVMDTVTD